MARLRTVIAMTAKENCPVYKAGKITRLATKEHKLICPKVERRNVGIELNLCTFFCCRTFSDSLLADLSVTHTLLV